jgi:hypothetical protein
MKDGTLCFRYKPSDMMKHELGAVIARRNYFSKREKSSAPVVSVEIGAPVKSLHGEGNTSVPSELNHYSRSVSKQSMG